MSKYYWNFVLREPNIDQKGNMYDHILHLESNFEIAEMACNLDEVHHYINWNKVDNRSSEIGHYYLFIHGFVDLETAWLIIYEEIEKFVKQRKSEQIWESNLPENLENL